MKKKYFVILFIIQIFLLSNCGKKIATVTIVDERTALEKQILGQFESLNKEIYFIASVRGINSDGKINKTDEMPESKRKTIGALQRIAFNADDVKTFKKLKVFGESNSGFIQVFEENLNKLDAKKKRLASEISSQENEDRKIIINRLIETNVNVSENEPAAVGKIFASMKRDASETGELIQTPDGKWREK